MVIKVRLIKSKKSSISCKSFYKTSQIKFNSLSIPSINKFRMRSTQKIIQYQNPWQQLDTQDINSLAQRLQDKPQELYQLVKQNISKRKLFQQQTNKLKFNKINFTQNDNIKNIKLQANQTYRRNGNPFINKSNSNLKLSNQSSPKSVSKYLNIQKSLPKGMFSQQQDKFVNNKLLNKIKQKRIQYEKQLKNLIRDKRLILQTDLPKINKIKATYEPNYITLKQNYNVNNKLPIWKLR